MTNKPPLGGWKQAAGPDAGLQGDGGDTGRDHQARALSQEGVPPPEIQVRQRPRKEDSAEVYVGEEFIGVLFRDDDEGETAYQFQMAILDYDLKD